MQPFLLEFFPGGGALFIIYAYNFMESLIDLFPVLESYFNVGFFQYVFKVT
jgi:hypothetical protein